MYGVACHPLQIFTHWLYKFTQLRHCSLGLSPELTCPELTNLIFPYNCILELNIINAVAQVKEVDSPKRGNMDLYYLPPSPPCRAVMMTAKAVGVDLNLKICNIMEGDHLKPEYTKLNPQHTIPTLDDNGFVLWESRAIMPYLVNQYAKDDSLYPLNPKERALVDHRLYFDMGTLNQRYGDYYNPVIFGGETLSPEKMNKLMEAVAWLNTMLEGMKFSAGDNLTIADIALVTTVSNLEACTFDLSPYPNITAWYARTKQALAPYGYEEINQSGANTLGQFFKSKLG